MQDDNDHSITEWVWKLQEGDEEAAFQLWNRYSGRVVQLARKKLGAFCRRVADEEDVAQSVFRRLCLNAKDGAFPNLRDREGLWNLLIVLTSNRVIDQKRHLGSQKRGGGRSRGDSVLGDERFATEVRRLDGRANGEVPVEMIVELAETHDLLMGALDNELAQVARWKLEELDNAEIAQRLDITPRSVRRKLECIREIWLRCLAN
jgi:DNA-directed RNA polymerase specialized sigma24 family protein